MRKFWLTTALLVVIMSLLLSACQPAAAPTEAPGAEQPGSGEQPAQPAENVTLRVLVHQNPPMVEFMDNFNKKF